MSMTLDSLKKEEADDGRGALRQRLFEADAPVGRSGRLKGIPDTHCKQRRGAR